MTLTVDLFGHINMTMKPLRKSIPAGEFKAKCLSLLDEVARSGEAVVITKRGKPVAEVVPFNSRTGGSLRGSVRFHDDITGSILDQWDIEK